MNREFLEGLGLEKDAVDGIMAEYGKSIQTFKDQNATLTEQITALNEKNGELSKKVTDTEEKYKDYDDIKAESEKLTSERDEIKNKFADEIKRNALVTEAMKQGAIDAKDITKYVDINSIVIDDNGIVTGLDKVAQLKADKPYLFEQKKTAKASGDSLDGDDKDFNEEEMRKAFGLPKK